MPIITSCPECSTQFVVTTEQLSAYNGKVRCGTCNHVFNANEYLIEDDRIEESNKENTADGGKLKSNEPKKGNAKATATKSNTTKTPTPKKVENLLKNVSLDEDDLSNNQTTKSNNPIESSDDSENHIEITAPTNYKNIQLDDDESTEAKKSANSPSLVKDLSIDERLTKLSNRKPFNWLLFFISFVLLLALLAQLIYFLRTEITSRFPQTKPWYALACKEIGCTVELPKQLELLTIDDSDMQEHLERENVLQFSSTLINHANYPQAYPNIELTLTNTDDEPVLRRTLKPNQYLIDNRISNGIASKEEVRIKINLNALDTPVAGYRVALTY